MKKSKRHVRSIDIEIEFQGQKYCGTYKTEREMISVESDYGSKAAPIGHSPPELLAKIMLRELVEARGGRAI